MTTLLGTKTTIRSASHTIAMCVLALSAAVLPQAQAATIQVSNFASPQNTSAAIGGGISNRYLATSFLTGNDDYWLEEAGVVVRNPGSIDLTVELSLWTDAANQPATRIYVFPKLSTLLVGANNTVIDSTASGVKLAANTAYWLAVRAAAGNALTWVATTSTAETSPSGWSISDSNYQQSNDSGATWAVQGAGTVIPIMGISASTVPEPGSFLLTFGGAAAGVLFLRRRRNGDRP